MPDLVLCQECEWSKGMEVNSREQIYCSNPDSTYYKQGCTARLACGEIKGKKKSFRKTSSLDIIFRIDHKFSSEHRAKYNHLGMQSITEKIDEGIAFLQQLKELYA